MAYHSEQVRRMLTQPGSGGIHGLAMSAGKGEGGSSGAEHQAAAQFLSLALALKGDGELFGEDRDFAEGELRRHQVALGLAASPPVSTRQHPRAV